MTTSNTDQTTPTQATPAKAAKAKAAKCLTPDCRRKPTHRGLCAAHWQTHRGLATPKEDTPDE